MPAGLDATCSPGLVAPAALDEGVVEHGLVVVLARDHDDPGPFETALPNAPKMASGEVVAYMTRELVSA